MQMNDEANAWLNPDVVLAALNAAASQDAGAVREVLQKARELKGLTLGEVAVLSRIESAELMQELFDTACHVKEQIYGRRMVMFAPLYISNICGNECVYCAFRSTNKALPRNALNMEQIRRETAQLIEQGHKRLLLVAGEGYPASRGGFNYILDAIQAIYQVAEARGTIRRVNVNVAPLEIDQYRALHDAGIGTYQLFQETYHRPTYAAVHLSGAKKDFDWRVSAMDRAMQAGIDDVGIGVLFGLADWRFDLLSMMQHIAHLEERFGVGCHTVSVPRMEPAAGAPMSERPPAAVSDLDFKKIVAILRVAVPYTGIIMSTRESAQMRRETYALGVSQVSAGSRTDPGGYTDEGSSGAAAGQFQLGDHRSLEEVVAELASLNYIPSFCTACYRLGRTGQDFMDIAKPGLIRLKCDPNAVTTFQEYLIDFADSATRQQGEEAIATQLAAMEPKACRASERMLGKIRAGKRDVYC
jgi:2-iminoacetate synthase